MQEREQAIERVREILERVGFYVSDAHGIRPTSFDLVARRDSTLLLLKILKNIDALSPEDAERLTELAGLFRATTLIVGRSSGASQLEAGVVYTRYGVPIVVEETFEEQLLHGVPPFLVSSPGGIFARIDGPRLQTLREARGLSLGALAQVAGVTRRTIQLYEEGGGAEVTVVSRLEQYLREPVVLPIELLPRSTPRDGGKPKGRTTDRSPKERVAENRPLESTGDPVRDDVFRRLGSMGWEVVVTIRCPFDAFTHGGTGKDEELLLTAVGSLRSAQHRAEVLQGIARAIEGYSMFVTSQPTGRESVDGLPLLSVPELRRHRDRAELLDLLHEREGT
ncbi:MAG: transcriptional regulator [Thermoplasmata archaeon]|nr:transcriptional regulator [Thermoplasmata archaeon]MCI4341631.1 transcriptional regulator [Thermoplasmata archaeon]